MAAQEAIEGGTKLPADRSLTRFNVYLWLTLSLLVCFVFSAVVYVRAEKAIDRANEQRLEFFLLADELRQSSDDLTRFVRTYVVTGNPAFKAHFQEVADIRDGKKPRPVGYNDIYWDLVLNEHRPRPMGLPIPLLDQFKSAGSPPEELSKLAQAKANSDALITIETNAMRLMESDPTNANTRSRAILMLHDDAYHLAKAGIMAPIAEFNRLANQRTLQAVETAERYALVSRLIFVLFGLALALLVWNLRRTLNAALGASIGELHTLITHLGQGNFRSADDLAKYRGDHLIGRLLETQERLASIDEARKQAEKDLRDSEDRFKALSDASFGGIIIHEKGLILECNRGLSDLTGFSLDELVGKNGLELIAPQSLDTVLANIKSGYDQSYEVVGVRKNGSTYPLAIRGKNVSYREREVRVIEFRDITERKEAQKVLEKLAQTDSLTGLVNRRHFMALAELELSRSIRYDRALSVLMMDVDLFKNINDRYGHKVGDTALVKLAEVCSETLRTADVIGRIGGEEFSILMPETSHAVAIEVAERLRKAIAETHVPLENGLPLQFTVSIGVTSLASKNDNMDVLLSDADKALYLAKHAGRNKVCSVDR